MRTRLFDEQCFLLIIYHCIIVNILLGSGQRRSSSGAGVHVPFLQVVIRSPENVRCCIATVAAVAFNQISILLKLLPQKFDLSIFLSSAAQALPDSVKNIKKIKKFLILDFSKNG